MTHIALVIWEDRHSDVGVFAFSDPAVAIAWAKQQAAEHCNRFGDLEEKEGEALSQNLRRVGWIYDARYGENDHIGVRLLMLDKEQVR